MGDINAPQQPFPTMRIQLTASQPQVEQQQTTKPEDKQARIQTVATPSSIQELHEPEQSDEQSHQKKQQAQQERAHAEAAHLDKTQASIDAGVSADDQKQYLAQILTHIEAHKFYPPTARRRGLEGVVHIRFTIMRPDLIENIHTSGVSDLLQQAAVATLHRAIPLPTPEQVVVFPIKVEYGMEFVLN